MNETSQTSGGSKSRPAENAASFDSLWIDIQAALDDAFDAVRKAQGRNSELSHALEEKTSVASKLEAECEDLRTRFEETAHEFETTKEELERLQYTSRPERVENSRSSDSANNRDVLILQIRKLEGRIGSIADALERLHLRTEKIRSHYKKAIGAEASLAAEINFARDEALAQICKAMKGVHIRRAERTTNGNA
jgi:chromosome segregation ATPase